MKGHIFDRDDGLTQEFTLSKFEKKQKQKQNSSLPKKLTAGSQVTVNQTKQNIRKTKYYPSPLPLSPLKGLGLIPCHSQKSVIKAIESTKNLKNKSITKN